MITLGVLAFLRPEVQHVIHLFNFTSLPLSSIEISACILIIIGIIIFLIGLFGLCGAKRESRNCLVLVSFNSHMMMTILIHVVYRLGNMRSSD